MSDYLTDEGFDAPRLATFLTKFREEYEAELEDAELPSALDWSDDEVLGILRAVTSAALDRLAEAAQALYDAFDVNNATGVQLDNLCLIVGVQRKPATFSTVSIQMVGEVGTVLSAGQLVEGGGEDGKARWSLLDDVTFEPPGDTDTQTATFRCTEAGAVAADPGDIDKIVTPVDGWLSATNPAAAEEGDDVEGPAALRQRRQASLQIAGRGTQGSLRGNLLALDYIEAAVVIDNDLPSVETIGGVTLQPHSVAVVLHPSTISTAEKQEVADLIYLHVRDGVYTNGTAVVATVTGVDGAEKTVRWDWATEVSVSVAITVVLDTGYVLADVETEAEEAVTDHFADLGVGDAVRRLQIFRRLAAIEGIAGATIELDGVAADYEPAITELAVAGATTVTE